VLVMSSCKVYDTQGPAAGRHFATIEVAEVWLRSNGFTPRKQARQWVAFQPTGNLFASVVHDNDGHVWTPNYGKAM
jgi:hypothetical protein